MSDQVRMKIIGGVPGIERYPELVEHFGRYVTRYVPENAHKHEQWLWTSEDPDEALVFDDMSEMHAFYKQSIGTRPWDGKPDRPLTAFHIEVTRL